MRTQVNTRSQFVAISRKVLLKCYFQVTITAIVGASGLTIDPALYDAPRANPIAAVTNTVKASIGNAQFSQTNYQVVPMFSRMNISDNQLSKALSLGPSMLDASQNYSDLQNLTQNPVTNTFQAGSVMDPLLSQGQSMMPTRGGWPMTIVRNDSGTPGVTVGTAVVQFESCEGLWLSPFLMTECDENALYGVQTLTLTLVFNNLARCWSHSDNSSASQIQTISASFYTNPEVHTNFISPSLTDSVPNTLVYPFSEVQVYQTDYPAAVAPGAVFSLNSQNIQLNTIPKRIAFFLRPSDSYINDPNYPARVATVTDTFAAIQSLQINFDNTSGLLSGASVNQIYQWSMQGGLNMSYEQFTTSVGSIVILDVPRVLALAKGDVEAPSLNFLGKSLCKQRLVDCY